MKLYFHPAAPNCIKVLVTATHLDIPLEHEVVDLFKGEQDQPAYRSVSPTGLVPALQDGDFVLWESNAITQFLAASRQHGSLLPLDERARSDVTRWQCWELAHWTPAVSVYLRENLFKRLKGFGGPDAAELAKVDGKFHALASLLDHHLERRPYLVGDGLRLADISVAAFLVYSEPARVPLEDYGHIRHWLAGIDALPAWQRWKPQVSPFIQAA